MNDIETIKKLVGLLNIAKCPDCDGSGVVVHPDLYGDIGEVSQCQFCYERENILGYVLDNFKEDDDEHKD